MLVRPSNWLSRPSPERSKRTMRRIVYISVAVLISTLPLTINAVLPRELHAASSAGVQSATLQMVKDSPPDTTPYARALIPDDFASGRNHWQLPVRSSG